MDERSQIQKNETATRPRYLWAPGLILEEILMPKTALALPLFFTLLIRVPATGQTVTFSWAKALVAQNGVSVAAVVNDRLGNSYVAGQYLAPSINLGDTTLIPSGANGSDFLAKISSTGDVLWARSSGSRFPIAGTALTCDRQGNIYLTGYFHDSTITYGDVVLRNSTPPAPSTSGTADMFLLKLDSQGKAIWGRTAGGAYGEHGTAIAVNESGESYLGGYFESAQIHFDSITVINGGLDGTRDFFLAKYDTLGHAEWVVSGVGQHQDILTSAAVGSDGSCVFGGYFNSDTLRIGAQFKINSTPASLLDDGFVGKVDNGGSLKWVKRFFGQKDDQVTAITLDDQGNSFLTGFFVGVVLVDTIEV
jgi:hypothetical protein